MSLKCYYHPEREATTKCEKCGKIICVECKMIFRKTVHRGTGDDSYSYTEKYEYCPICYYDAQIKKSKSYSYGAIGIMIFSLIVIIAMFIVPIGIFNSIIVMFGFLGVIISIIVFIYSRFIYSPKKTTEYNGKKEEFLQNIKTPRATKTEEIATNFCPECGTKVELGASVCSYCGFMIKE